MKTSFGGWLRPFTFALSCILVAGAAHAAHVVDVRYSTSVEKTRVVIDLDSRTPYKHQPLADPPRILVEMPSGSLGSNEPKVINDGYVKRVRRQRLSDGRIQVVLDLERGLDYEVFPLEGKNNRIVVDVKHTGAPAPAVPPPAREPDPEPEPAKAELTPPTVTPPDAAKPETRKKTTPAVSNRTGPWVVAVDPGHGQEPGAQGHGANEKDITLSLAKLTVDELNKLPGVEAFLTRKGDYYVSLWKRTEIAKEKHADLFVSIHCNASENPAAKGTEVFFLSLERASDEAARALAERENAVDREMGIEVDAPDIDKILFDMMQTDVLVKSEYLAETCLDKLFGLGTVYNRGVKQAGFAVLKSPSIPSILVEAAFITNQRENALLRDRDWQRMFSRLLADGIGTYIRSVQEAEPTALADPGE